MFPESLQPGDVAVRNGRRSRTKFRNVLRRRLQRRQRLDVFDVVGVVVQLEDLVAWNLKRFRTSL